MMQPGVDPNGVPAYVLTIGDANRFSLEEGKQ